MRYVKCILKNWFETRVLLKYIQRNMHCKEGWLLRIMTSTLILVSQGEVRRLDVYER